MIELAPGTVVRVAPPALPTVTVAPPSSSSVVVPVQGPPGPTGPTGGDPAVVQGMIDTAVQTHVVAPEPHPAYDDIPSLVLLFENRLV